MHYSIHDFLSATGIPPLTTNVAARTTRDVHFRLVGVAAVGALPDELTVFLLNLDFSIPAADLAVVGLRIDFSIHDGVVDILNQRDDRLQIVLQIRYFDVADSAAGRELLELGLELELGEGIDMLAHIDVVAVGDITVVGDAGDDAETTLQVLCELVGRRLHRGAVEGERDVFLLTPLSTLVVHVLHYRQGKSLAAFFGVGMTGHVLHALIEACISERNRRVAVIEQLVDGLTGLQTRKSAELPQDRGNIAERALKTVVAAHECTVAQVQSFIEDFPEIIHVLLRGERDVDQIDGHDASSSR